MKNNQYHEHTYYTTLKFILIKAIYEFDQDANVKIRHSLNGGIYGEIISGKDINDAAILEIKEKMQDIIKRNNKIDKINLSVDEINEERHFKQRPDLISLVNNSDFNNLNLYNLEDVPNYFHNGMYESTGAIYLFDLISYGDGFILRYPYKQDPTKLVEYIEHPKLAKIFNESHEWGSILELENVGKLNQVVKQNNIHHLIRVNEALHHKKIAKIAEKIADKDRVKIITIAGPSSSGKTTFTERLGIHLQVNGLKPEILSLDNYYMGRNNIPYDENGEKDFEALEALDLKLLNEHLQKIILGEEVETPLYDFHKGEREKNGKNIKLKSNGVLLIEGIHGLNNKLLEAIDDKLKYKIYISCLTTLNIDNHNRIPSSEVRKIRRIVRDSISRGTSAEGTLDMWDSVRKGEVNNIFPYQEEADSIFDSNLVYELGVLKKYALEELEKIEVTSKYFEEASRLIKFIKYFKEIPEYLVPDDSILKEFIGGSYFYSY